MRELLAPARLLDLVIVVVVVEGLVLARHRRRTGRGMPVREVVAFLGAGLALLVAARAAVGAVAPLAPRPLAVFALAMLAALAAHVWHLAQRWDR